MTGQTTEVGQRVALVRSNDPHTKLEPGMTGTVRFIDDLGTVHVKWDNGASLGLVEVDGDQWIVIAPAQMSQAPTQ